MHLRKAPRPSLLILLVLSLVVACTDTNGNPPGGAPDAISVQLNQTSTSFGFGTGAELSDDGSLLVISGSAAEDSLAPSLQLTVESVNGPVTAGTYRLEANPDHGVSAQYAIGRAEDGAIVTNTVFEARDIGNESDLIITIASVDHRRVSGTFSGVVTTDEEVTIDNLITMTQGRFDVHVETS